jgi:hypothetical protein
MEGIKKAKKKGVDIRDVFEFSKYNQIDLNIIKGLFRHEITTKGNSPELSGLKGKEIGEKIAELELEKFIKKWL